MLKPEPSVQFQAPTTRNHNVRKSKFDWYYNPYSDYVNDCHNITVSNERYLQEQLPIEQINPKKSNWHSISSLKNEGQSCDERNSRERKSGDDEKSTSTHNPSLNHIISSQHPDFSKLVIRRCQVSPNVQMHKSPCLISSDEQWINNNN